MEAQVRAVPEEIPALEVVQEQVETRMGTVDDKSAPGATWAVAEVPALAARRAQADLAALAAAQVREMRAWLVIPAARETLDLR